MKPSKKITNEPRREFLKKVAGAGGAGGVGAVAFGVLHPFARSRKGRDDPRENTPSGYRLTDHIRTYYDKAKI